MPRRRKRSAAVASDLMLAPMVVALRLPILAAEASKAGPTPEAVRAATEKMAAFAEGMTAAQMAYARAMWSFWPEVMSGRRPTLFSSGTGEKAVLAALTPARRRLKANFRRLNHK